jgi:serine/threonine protein kinase
MKPLAPNTLLQNRYLVVQLIGKGGMGEVYLAVDQRLGSAVALKRTFFSDDETLMGAFEREARTLARLRHPVLPKVSDHFTENENQYLVMDHISGDDLSKRLEATQKPFPLSWVLFWADQLLDALAYLHTHEPPIIHRDIKPQNLKLTSENNIVLLDFGLSKNSVGETRITSSGSVGFTPHYAPMEQIRGTGTSPRSDIYSLSATLYQLLTNKVPPDALSRADSLLNGAADPLEPLEKLNAEVLKVVADVIQKGMSVSQEQRFASAREMQRELREAYAQMQKTMSAQTVAFNAQGENLAQAADDSAGKTEPMPVASNEIQTPVQANVQTHAISPAFDEEIAQGDTVPYNSQPQTADKEPDFEKTLAYDSPPLEFPAKQSDIKTEVFSSDFSSVPETPNTQENFAADATIPVISSDALTGEDKSPENQTNLNLTEKTDENIVVAPVPIATENSYPTDGSAARQDAAPADIFEQNREQYAQQKPKEEAFAHAAHQPTPAAVYPAAVPAKKSKGKSLAIVGVLAALLFLAAGAGGVGWYYYKNSVATVPPTPTPSPESTVAITPTPEQILVETNTNTNSNATVENPSNTNNQTTNQQELTTTVTPGTTPKPTTQPSAVKPTPKKTDTSTAGGTPKPTQAKTPKKDDRTVILQ